MLSPARQEVLVDGEQVPPGDEDALGVRFQVGSARHEVQVGHVGAVSVEQDDFLEAVVGEGFRYVEDVMDEMFEVVVDGARKIDHVARVAEIDRGKDETVRRGPRRRSQSHLGRAQDVDVEGQVGTVLLHGAAGNDTDLAGVDGVTDLGPREFFVAVFLGGSG